MALRLPQLKMPLLVAAMGAMVLSAGAQSSDRSIIFSTPKTDDDQAATPSLTPQNSQMPVLPDSLQAPDPALNFQAPNDLPQPPPSGAVTPQDQRMKKILDERKNWTLMTPEEIMGVTPTDELLQPPERDAMGREKNTTQMERFLDRENRMRGGLTNDWQSDRGNSAWNLSRNQDALNALDPGRDSTMDAVQRLNEFLNSRRIGEGAVNHNDKILSWDSFDPPAPQTPEKQDLEQQAAMERFRQLLQPSPAPATGSSPDSKYFPVPKTTAAADPYMTQPDYVPNPAGASYTPLTTGFGKPTGLTPLPGVVNSGIAPAAPPPAWAPQPAPWLSQGPQPFVMPQRKF